MVIGHDLCYGLGHCVTIYGRLDTELPGEVKQSTYKNAQFQLCAHHKNPEPITGLPEVGARRDPVLQVLYEGHYRCSCFTTVYSPRVKVRFSMEVSLKERHDTQEGKYKYRARSSMLLKPHKMLQK